MIDLKDSVVIQSLVKRKPYKKQFRLMFELMHKMVDEVKRAVRDKKYHVPTEKMAAIRKYNERIKRRLEKEDLLMKDLTQTELDFKEKTFLQRIRDWSNK